MNDLQNDCSREAAGEPGTTGELVVPAQLDNLERVQDFVREQLVRMDCPPAAQYQLVVALEEMFVNVCYYAYADKDEPGDVRVAYVCGFDPPAVTVQLVDSGVPFDPLAYDPELPTDVKTAKIGGLGIHMSRKCTDDFSYVRDGDYNVVSFSKRW